MKKLKDFEGQKIAIHFPTYELQLRRREINPSDNCKDLFWDDNKETTCYNSHSRNGTGGYAGGSYYKSEGYTILPATDFLEEEFIYGQEYEFSDNGDFKPKSTRQFVAKSTCGKYFITWSKNTSSSSYYKYARKINTERSESITTAKDLISKFDIKQEELFKN